MQKGEKHKDFPAQEQIKQPGDEYKMNPQPEFWDENYRASGKLENKVALITGGDSGIGRSVAVHFAAEGADVAILFLEESQDALDTAAFIREYFTKEPLPDKMRYTR